VRRALVAAAAAAVVGIAGCGGDDPEDSPPPSAPARTATSPVFGVPLPEAATPDPDLTKASFESFFVPADEARFSDLEAFFRSELDEKPFRDLAWCGTAVDDRHVYAVRVWKRDGGDDVFTLTLRFEPAEGTYINATQETRAGQECPPPPLDQ